MCRLYVFRSTEQTKVECTLAHAQNALMAQSRRDLAGHSHAHGWGIVTYDTGSPLRERQAWAAYHGEHFSRAASRAWSTVVLAHVRHATVGTPALENTHPFVDGRLSFAHNGTVPHFADVKPHVLAETSAHHRSCIRGETDSEHLFRHLLTLHDADPESTLVDLLRRLVANVQRWLAPFDDRSRLGLNLVLTDGMHTAGTRWGRSLHRVERQGVYDCEICGFPHIHHEPDRDHRAVVVASEPITHEHWLEVPDHALWSISPAARWSVEPW